jgi:hypothetical protein
MSGIAMRTIVPSIVTINAPMVVLTRAIHL